MLRQKYVRIRFTLAMLAMLGAMWASVDLHQHQDGLHQSAQCVVCSIEKAVPNGFAFYAAIQIDAIKNHYPAVTRLLEYNVSTFSRSLSIRAPPLS